MKSLKSSLKDMDRKKVQLSARKVIPKYSTPHLITQLSLVNYFYSNPEILIIQAQKMATLLTEQIQKCTLH